MLEIQHVSEIKKCLCVAKAQITFIRSCVNRYSWWNKPCDLQFTQLWIEAYTGEKNRQFIRKIPLHWREWASAPLQRRVIWKYYMMTQFHIHNEIGSALLLNTNI